MERLRVSVIGTVMPGQCHFPEPPFNPDDQFPGRLWRPLGGVHVELVAGFEWLLAEGVVWEPVFPPRGLSLVREFAALDEFDAHLAVEFASRWGFLRSPHFPTPRQSLTKPLVTTGEEWMYWMQEIGHIRALLAVHEAVTTLRAGEDKRSRDQIMAVLRPRTARAAATGISTPGAESETSRAGTMGIVASLHTSALFLDPGQVREGGLDAVVPERKALISFGALVLTHFLRQWGAGQIHFDLSEPPNPKLRPTFNRLGGALYLSLAEAVSAPRRPRRRCMSCGQPMNWERSSRRYCNDVCKHRYLREHPRARHPGG